jgi:hypothetical protein
MKYLKLTALLLSIALSTHLKAEVIDQPFSPTFGPEGTSTDPGETDGWKYAVLAHTTEADKVYYGDAAIYMESYSWVEGNGHLTSPEKAGGVGWITFVYKTHNAYSWYQGNCELVVQLSEDGETFTSIDTVRTSIQEETWVRYSKVLNNAGAKYVKLELLKNLEFTANVAIDEIGITDYNATAPVNLSLSFGSFIESEVGQAANIPSAFLVNGNVPGGVTLSLDKGESSPFTLGQTAITSLTAGTDVAVAVGFTPAVKNVSSDFIKVSGNNLPNLAFPITGLGLERTIIEGFNPESSSTSYGNSFSFDYLGWSVVNGSFELYNSESKYEGGGVLRFSGSLTSPKKIGGIGSFSFFYRAEKIYDAINFIVFSSTDGTAWTEIDRLTASSPHFTQYIKTLTGDANFVKVELETPSSDSSSPLLLIDAFSITAKDAPLASASGHAVTYLAGDAPYSFSVPVTFANLTGNVTVSIDNTQLQAGTVSENAVAVTYNPEDGKKYAAGILTVSGGGLNFPVKIPVSAYPASDGLFTDFDGGNWQGSYNLFYYTSDGWTLINGQQIYYNTGFNSPAAAQVNAKGSLISPPKSGGVGDIQFYAKGASSYTPSNFSVYVSADGVNWGTAIGTVVGVPVDSYQEYNYTVNDANAKYVKVAVSGYECIFENFTITQNGVGISKLSFAEAPVFVASQAAPQTLSLNLEGMNITSDLTVAFKQGNAFSSTVTTISKNEFDDQTYALPVTFQPGEGLYFQDTLVVSGDCFAFDYTLPLKGYIVQGDLLFENFDDPFIELSYGNYVTANAWTITNGSRDTYEAGFGSAAAAGTSYSGGEIVSPPKSGGIGSIQFYAKVGYSPATLTLSVSENGTDWTPLDEVISVTATSSYTEYTFTVGNDNAKYMKIVSNSSCYFENITVTSRNAVISKVSFGPQPLFVTEKGNIQTQNLELSGDNITSDLTVGFKQGKAFSSDVTTISASDVNGKTYELPLKFGSETGSYWLDTLVISGSDLPSAYLFPLKGIIKQDLLYQGFNGNWVEGASYDLYNVDGWEITHGNRDTYSHIYEGSAAVNLSRSSYDTEPASIFSLPKSGGVGVISFYYKTYSDPATVRVLTYKTLADEPVIVETIEVPSGTPYTNYTKAVNDANAQYVEIQLLVGSVWSGVYIDAIAVTAKGKGIPKATVPETIFLSAYEEEQDIRTFDFQFENVEDEIRLSLNNDAGFSIDKKVITPSAATTTAAVKVSYTPVESFSADVLLIESAGLLTPISIPVHGNVLKDTLFQDFNQEGWEMNNEGNTVLDGWVITKGRRTYPSEMIEGDPNTGGSLRISADKTQSGSLVSPAKSGGINTVEFYYRSQYNYYTNSVNLLTEVSANGQTWTNVDTLNLTGNEYQPNKHLYSKEIKNNNAKYFRIRAVLPSDAQAMGEGFLFIDSIAIDALPYLRRVGDAPEVRTSALPATVPVQVAGILNNSATISLETSTHSEYFSLEKTTIAPGDVAGEAIASFNVLFNGPVSVGGEYLVRVHIAQTDDGIDLNIPVTVIYEKPYLEVVNNIQDQETLTVPVLIPIEINGLLNTDATITMAVGTNYTPNKTTLTPAELEGDLIASIQVSFTAEAFGTYKDTLIIANADIETIRVPLSVLYRATGMENVSGNLSVYLSKDGNLKVLGAQAGAQVTVIDIQGRPVFSGLVRLVNERFEVSLQTGVYIVKVGDKTWKVKK